MADLGHTHIHHRERQGRSLQPWLMYHLEALQKLYFLRACPKVELRCSVTQTFNCLGSMHGYSAKVAYIAVIKPYRSGAVDHDMQTEPLSVGGE